MNVKFRLFHKFVHSSDTVANVETERLIYNYGSTPKYSYNKTYFLCPVYKLLAPKIIQNPSNSKPLPKHLNIVLY